jgi:hypothetical protein
VSDKLLNSEISYSMNEAQFVIEQWRKHYNTTAAFIARTSTTGAADDKPDPATAGSGRALSITLIQKIRQAMTMRHRGRYTYTFAASLASPAD